MRRHLSAMKSRARRTARDLRRPPIDRTLANEVAARAIAEAVLVSSTELIEADDGDASAPTVPVVVCLWDRLDRLPRLLRSVQHSVGVRPQIYLWNNRADAVDRVLDDVRSASSAPVMVATSALNIGGFGRFYWARELADRHPFVVFLDDDQLVDGFALAELVRDARPQTLQAVWAFSFDNHREYWRRRQVRPGEPARYLGTGGMVADASIFTDAALFGCPEQYWFVEDLWLSYYARAVRGWHLVRSHAEIGMIFDGKDQYRSLRQAKSDFFRELSRDARWREPLPGVTLPAPRSKEPSLDPA